MKSLILFSTLLFCVTSFAKPKVVVGSKIFTESYILAEIAAQTLSANHVKVDKRFGLGGTGLLFEALDAGEIDVYPEYTGTIAESILKNPTLRDWQSIQTELKKGNIAVAIFVASIFLFYRTEACWFLRPTRRCWCISKNSMCNCNSRIPTCKKYLMLSMPG